MSELNEEKLNAVVGKVLGDLGGAYSVPLVRIGDALGFFQSLHKDGPATSDDLARRSGCSERYVREWCAAMAASEYLDYDAAAGKFSLSPEYAMVFAIEDSPVYMIGGFAAAAAASDNFEKVSQAFRTGDGVGWGDQAGCLFCAVARFFRPGYANHLVQEWIPALKGIKDKLDAGARVADIGCGHGLSTLIMAEAFPNSEFVGIDFHEPSIVEARKHASQHGVSDRVRFETSTVAEAGGDGFDLVTFFDCLHDMGDPVGAMTHVKTMMKPDGAAMIVEPMAGSSLEDNLNPVGRLFYSASTMICVPTSLDQEVGLALGAQAGEERLRDVVTQAGFSQMRRAAETPFNMILEARV